MMTDAMDELIETYDNYIKLLGDELTELAGMARVHGWKSNRVEEGYKFREKIKTLKNLIIYD